MASYPSPRPFRQGLSASTGRQVLWLAVFVDLAVLVFNDLMIARTFGAAAGFPAAAARITLFNWNVHVGLLETAIGLSVLGTLVLSGIALWILVGVDLEPLDHAQVGTWGVGFGLCMVPILALWFKSGGLALGLSADLNGFVAAQTIVTSALLVFPIGFLSRLLAIRIVGPGPQRSAGRRAPVAGDLHSYGE